MCVKRFCFCFINNLVNFNLPFFFSPGFVHCQNTQLLLLGVLRKLLFYWILPIWSTNFFYLLLLVWFCQFLEIRRRLAVAVVRQWIHQEDFRTCFLKKLTLWWINKIFDLYKKTLFSLNLLDHDQAFQNRSNSSSRRSSSS